MPHPTQPQPAAPLNVDGFYVITLGERMLFCAHAARCGVEAFAAELAYWRGLLGEAVEYHIADAGDDLGFVSIALAIYSLAPDGSGVSAQLLIDMGYNAALVHKHFETAKLEVQRAVTALPANVVRFRRAR
jgi:hypothetical protein